MLKLLQENIFAACKEFFAIFQKINQILLTAQK